MAEKKGGASDGPRGSIAGESIADYARREMAEIADREKKKQAYLELQKRIAVEVPARFFTLAERIRAEVDTFNQIVDAPRRISLHESMGLAARADHTRAELNLTLSRHKCEAWVGLSELMRLGRGPTAYIIEARLQLGRARVRVRAEGVPRDGDVGFRVSVDGTQAAFGIDELASRLVLAVAKDDPTVLGAVAEPV